MQRIFVSHRQAITHRWPSVRREQQLCTTWRLLGSFLLHSGCYHDTIVIWDVLGLKESVREDSVGCQQCYLPSYRWFWLGHLITGPSFPVVSTLAMRYPSDVFTAPRLAVKTRPILNSHETP